MAEFALFISAFLAATILPFSSEATFLLAITNDMPIFNAMLSASSGNVLGVVVNYALGYFLYEKTKTKLFSSSIGKRAYSYGHKYGYVALLFSWLPIVGDPLTLVAGLVRLEFVWFVLLVATLRVGRYYFLMLML